MQDKTVIVVENVSKTFVIYDKQYETIRDRFFNFFTANKRRKIVALKNVSFNVKKGEFFSVVGRNGSGKSTLLLLMAKAFPPDSGGFIDISEKFMRLSLGMGFNQELTARQNIMINSSIMGLTIKEIKQSMNEIIEFAEFQDFVDTKVKYFSSGMKSRLMFAIAVNTKAEILLIDEFFGGVGDLRFQQKAHEVFQRKIIDGRTIIHVSHNMENVLQYSDRALLLEKGECLHVGNPKDVVEMYNKIINC